MSIYRPSWAGDPVYNDDSSDSDWQKRMEQPLYPEWAADTGFTRLRIASELQATTIAVHEVPFGPRLKRLECQNCGHIWVEEYEN